MSEPIDIWPDGDIEFGTAVVEGDTIIVVQMPDAESGRTVRLYLREPVFVAFADHVKMVADRVVSGEFGK